MLHQAKNECGGLAKLGNVKAFQVKQDGQAGENMKVTAAEGFASSESSKQLMERPGIAALADGPTLRTTKRGWKWL